MKSLVGILISLLLGHVGFAKEKIINSDSRVPFFYCLDAKAKAYPLKTEESAAIEKSCEGEKDRNKRKACEAGAHRSSCESQKVGVPLYASLNDIQNRKSCEDVANDFLQTRGLGRLDKPAANIQTTIPYEKSGSGLPKFQFKVNPAPSENIYASESVDQATKQTNWTLKVMSSTNVPSFEQKLTLGVNGERVQKGEYTRTYNFKVIDNICVLSNVESSFLGTGQQYTESDYLDKNNCHYMAQTIHGENYSKSVNKRPVLANMGNFLCSEMVGLYNAPAAKVASDGGKDKVKAAREVK
jgi:hypothetical protein